MSMPRRLLTSLLSLATATSALTLVSVAGGAAPARAAAGDPPPFTIVSGSDVGVTIRQEPPDSNGFVHWTDLKHGYGSSTLGQVALTSDGTKGWIDKGQDGSFGGHSTDSKIFPIDITHGTIGDAQSISCEGPQDLTISPDDQWWAVYCSGDHKAEIIRISDRTTLANIEGISTTTIDFAWTADKSILWMTTDVGVLAWHNGQLLTVGSNAKTGSDIRVLPDGDAITVNHLFSGDAELLERFHYDAGSNTFSNTEISLPGNGGLGSAFALDPSGAAIIYRDGTSSLRRVSVATGATLASYPYALPSDIPIAGMTTDATGTRLALVMVHYSASGSTTFTESVDISGGTASPIQTSMGSDYGLKPNVVTAPSSTAAFGWTGGLTGAPIHFDASASTPSPGSTITSYHWDFGNGATVTTTSPTYDYQYSSASTGSGYPVTLTVGDSLAPASSPYGLWDGRHWFSKAGPKATTGRFVPVGATTSQHLVAAQLGQSNTGELPYGSKVDLTVELQPYSEYTKAPGAANQKVTFYEATPTGSMTLNSGTPVTSYDDGNGHVIATLSDVPVGAPGVHTFSTTTDDDGTRNIQHAQSNDVTVTIDDVTTALGISTPPATAAAGTPVTLTASLTTNADPAVASCAGGSYTWSVDGGITAVHDTSSALDTSDTFSTSTLPPGLHTLKALWTPGPNDVCDGSASVVRSVRVGTLATVTALAGPVHQRPGAATFSTQVYAPGDGVPPSGTVTLFDGTTRLGQAALTTTGANTFPVTFSTYGPHALTATYAYDGPSYGSSTSAPVALLVDDAPAPPAIRDHAPKPGRLQLRITPPDAHGSAITAYTVTCTSPQGPTGSARTTTTDVTVSGLRNNVDYSCSATATNAIGTSLVGPAHKARPGALPKVTLKASRTKVTKRTKVTLSGVVTAAGQVQARRPMTLTVRVGSSKKRTVIAHTTTDSKGRFHFTVTVTKAAAYQATTTVGPAVTFNKEVAIKLTTVKRAV